MYTYSAKLIRVIDGDTVDLEIDLGFDLSIRQRLKLYGVGTPDSRSADPDTKQKGLEAKQRLNELLPKPLLINQSLKTVASFDEYLSIGLLPKQFKVSTILNKRGKYGRVLGIIYLADKDSGKDVNINELMVSEGHAVKYTIQGK